LKEFQQEWSFTHKLITNHIMVQFDQLDSNLGPTKGYYPNCSNPLPREDHRESNKQQTTRNEIALDG